MVLLCSPVQENGVCKQMDAQDSVGEEAELSQGPNESNLPNGPCWDSQNAFDNVLHQRKRSCHGMGTKKMLASVNKERSGMRWEEIAPEMEPC